jgi:hypothetical protein
VVPYNLGCHAADVNCTHAGCSKTPQPSSAALEAQWEQMYIKWFAALKAHWPKLLWVNNVVDTLQPALINVSNGRMFEGGDGLGLDSVYNGHITIADRIVESRKWSIQARQPSFVHLSMNSAIGGSWRVGRWQNLVTEGESESSINQSVCLCIPCTVYCA